MLWEIQSGTKLEHLVANQCNDFRREATTMSNQVLSPLELNMSWWGWKRMSTEAPWWNPWRSISRLRWARPAQNSTNSNWSNSLKLTKLKRNLSATSTIISKHDVAPRKKGYASHKNEGHTFEALPPFSWSKSRKSWHVDLTWCSPSGQSTRLQGN